MFVLPFFKGVLSQTQDKALRRIGELREVISFTDYLLHTMHTQDLSLPNFWCLCSLYKIFSLTQQGFLLLAFICLYRVISLACFPFSSLLFALRQSSSLYPLNCFLFLVKQVEMCVVLAVLLGPAVDVPVLLFIVLRSTNVRQSQVIGTF